MSISDIDKAAMLKELAKELKERGAEIKVISDDPLEVMPTGFPGLDYDVMRCGGLPMGRIIEIFGKEGSGKSALAQRIMAIAQRTYTNRFVGLVDSEATFMHGWMTQNGVDCDLLQYAQTNIQEEAFKQAMDWLETGRFSVIVIDSLANLMPSKMAITKDWYEVNKKTGYVESDYAVGVFSKLTTDFCKKAVMPASKHKTLLVIINQVRADIGGFSRPGMPPPLTTPGGHAFGHDMTNRIVMSKVEDIEDPKTKEIIGFRSKASMRKSKVSIGGGVTDDTSHLAFYFENGIQKTEVYGAYDLAIRKGIITTAGAWVFWNWEGEQVRRWQGQKNAINHLMDNADDLSLLKAHISKSGSDGTFSSGPEDLSIEIMEE